MGRFAVMSAVAMLALAQSAIAQDAERRYTHALREGRYLEALDIAAVPDGIPPQAAESYMRQLNGWLYSMTGRHFLAYGLDDGAPVTAAGATEEIGIPSGYLDLEAVDAVAAIRQEAQDRRVVIINEAHHDARHRAFTKQLVDGLAADGFTHFAAEAFHATQDDLDLAFENGYPVRELGFYVVEPVFADLVRTTFALGLAPVRYEQTPDQACEGECSSAERIRARERAQARNLADALAESPDGRFIVHAGYSHVDERGDENEDGVLDGWMAAELKALTGIDPLTIDQETGSGYGRPRIPPVHARMMQEYDVSAPTVFRRPDGSWFADPEARTVDMLVVHPPLRRLEDGRPAWLAMDGYRKPVGMTDFALPETRPLLVQAFVEGEEGATIPMDQYLLREGESGDANLLLPSGRYRIRAQRLEGEDIDLGEVSVP